MMDMITAANCKYGSAVRTKLVVHAPALAQAQTFVDVIKALRSFEFQARGCVPANILSVRRRCERG